LEKREKGVLLVIAKNGEMEVIMNTGAVANWFFS
jgi:hypothetical protein